MELCQDGFGDSSSSATLTNESKCQHGGRGGAVEAESSPTDRVERLLRKYRVRKKVCKCVTNLTRDCHLLTLYYGVEGDLDVQVV